MRKITLIIVLLLCSVVIAAVTTLNAFNKGELSPSLEGRTDTKAYYSGCRTMENFVIQAQGGVTKRPGTEYIGDTNGLRIIPFEYSVDDVYILSFSDSNVGFYRTTD